MQKLYVPIILCAFLVLQCTFLQAQNLLVSETVSNGFENGSGSDTYLSPHSVIGHDGSINVITTYFGTYDMAIVKYSPSGEVLNQILIKNMVPITTTSFIDPQKYLLMDEENNYYVLGTHGSSNQSLEIQKISASGNWLWTYDYPQFPINDVSYARSAAFALDQNGDIITAGVLVLNNGPNSNFMIKLSPDGQPIWSKTGIVPGYSSSQYFKIIIDGENNIYLGGCAADANSFDSYFLAQKFTTSGHLLWTNVLVTGGSNPDASVLDMALAPSGNLYATGYKSFKMFTIKYDLSGNTIWSKDYEGPGTSSLAEYSHAIFLDSNENVYIAGESDQLVTSIDLTAIKYDKNGTQQWVTSYPFNLHTNFIREYFAGAALDDNDNLVLNGFADDTTDSPFDSYLKELYLRLDPDGNIIYSELHHGGEPFDQNPNDLIMDPSGNTYVAGSTHNLFNDLPSLYLLKRNSNDQTLYEVQYQAPLAGKEYHKSALVDKSGNFYSANNISGQGDHPRQSYRYDGDGNQTQVNNYSDGNLNRMVRDQLGRILICGTVNNDPNLVLCDSGGTQIWSRNLSDKGFSTDIASDINGNVYATGFYTPKNDSTNIFVAKYDALGTNLWSVTYSGAGLANDEAYAMCIDNASNIFITGRTQAGNTYYPILLKYDANGNLLWSLIPPSVSNALDFGADVVPDNSGGCFVTGRFTQSQPTKQGFVVIKVSAAGAVVKKMYRTGAEQNITDFGTHLYFDQNKGRLYAEGRVMKDGQPFAISVMKLKPNLQQVWFNEKSGFNYAYDDSVGTKVPYNDPLQFAVDSKSNVYITNVKGDTYDVEVYKLNKSGVLKWTYTDTTGSPAIHPSPDLVCDDENNLWAVFNVSSASITSYDWRILKFKGGSPFMKMEEMQTPEQKKAPDLELTVYPNPSQENVNLHVLNVEQGRIEIVVYNLLNQKFFDSVDQCEESSFAKTISLKGFPPGIYNVTVKQKSKQLCTKLIKI